jgi:hypothetical protein
MPSIEAIRPQRCHPPQTLARVRAHRAVSASDLRDLPVADRDQRGWPWTEAISEPPTALPDGLTWPRISIVTPSYNQGEYVEETIRSVLLQSYPNLEYIVMDGGSTDGSVEIIRKYESWLSYVHVGPDGGQSAAIAEGFRHATGEILAWLNSDDRYRPGTLRRAAVFFSRREKLTFAAGDSDHIDAEGRFICRSPCFPAGWFFAINTRGSIWPQPSSFWRRAAYEKAGGMDASLRFSMDKDLFVRLDRINRCRRIPGPPMADFRVHGSAKSSTMKDVSAMETALLTKKYGCGLLRPLTPVSHLVWLSCRRLAGLLSSLEGYWIGRT